MAAPYASCKAAIIGCAGTSLTPEESALLSEHRPVGLILFARNCESPAQVKALVASFREATHNPEALVLIDQEGGRVARMRPPQWEARPPAGTFAELAKRDMEAAKRAVYLNARLIADDLISLGINVDCAPLLDIPVPGAHGIIGDRAFGEEPEQVTALAEAMCQGLLDGGVLPVIKHIPGHGRAREDSHVSLPVVKEPLSTLRECDFVPFQRLSHMPMAMTAHILYPAIDAERVATLSPTVVQLIREEIGFDGVLMSDDLDMKALSGSLAALTQGVIAAGCDLALHCTGQLADTQAVLEASPVVSNVTLRRLEAALALPAQQQWWRDEATQEVTALLAVL